MKKREPGHSLGWRDYYQIAVSVAMVPLGGVVVWRSQLQVPLAVAVGIGFLAMGLYRLTLVWRYLSDRGGKP
ncbi:MAG: hypothetical protein H5U02_06670 [Clostridia bacterium]|nr:hypothetical protein [Clostridia bacterium]